MRGERKATRGPTRARYYAERATLAALLKNYSLLSLLWVLPAYVVQSVAKITLWALSRRFEEALTPRGAARARILAWLAEGAREVTWALCTLPGERWALVPPGE